MAKLTTEQLDKRRQLLAIGENPNWTKAEANEVIQKAADRVAEDKAAALSAVSGSFEFTDRLKMKVLSNAYYDEYVADLEAENTARALEELAGGE